MTKVEKIDKATLILPDKYYSPKQIFLLNVFKWIRSYDMIKRWVKKDIESGNTIFKAVKSGQGKGTRYLIKGSVILGIIEESKNGKVF